MLAKKNSTFSPDLLNLMDHSISGKMILEPVQVKGEIVDFKILYLNRSLFKLTGIGKEALQKSAKEVLSGFKNSEVLELASSVINSGESASRQDLWNREDSMRWVLIQVVKLSEFLILTLVDITRQKQIEEDLKRKEKLLSETQDLANIGSWSWDLTKPDDQSVTCSDHVYKIYEITDADFKPGYDFFLEKIVSDDRERIQSTIKEALERSKPYEVKYRIKVEDHLKYLEVRAIPKLDENGNVLEYIGIIRDVTFERNQEEIIRRTKRRMKRVEKVASSQRIAKSIAHEIRNPLTNIALASEQLRSEVDNESRTLFLDMIARNGHRIDKLIKELMKSANPEELNIDRHDINNIVEKALSLAMDRAKLRNVKIIKEYEKQMCAIGVDHEKVETAILNVLINAIEAVEDGSGTVKIETELTKEECIVRISDNGEGIEEEYLTQLFDPFYTGTKKGLGLGLTTTLSIIDSHDGHIEVESELGKGTTFILSFKR